LSILKHMLKLGLQFKSIEIVIVLHYRMHHMQL
jgi:hypothetical protein